jgi:hypothetical protein
MRKLLFLISFLSILSAHANAQWRLGPEAGLNMSNIAEKADGNNNSNSIIPGARLGCIFDYEFNDNFSFQPGIFFSMMGCYRPGSNTFFQGLTTVIPNVTTSINYAHIPVNFIYKSSLGPGRVFIGGGPYLAWAITGQNKTEAYNVGAQSGKASTDNIKFGTDSSSTKALDYGLNITAGYELPSGLLFRAGYSYGFSNLSNINGQTDYNTCIFICVAWLLGGPSYR